MKVFSDYAQYYDLLNQHKDYKQEVSYIISLFDQFAPDANTLLELGCGTGKHAIHFAEKGYHLMGIDQSTEMVTAAQERKNSSSPDLNPLMDFEVGDIRTYSTDRIFDVAISLFHVISYQVSNQDLSQSFKTVSKHLKLGGVFIFDCWYGPAVLSDKPYKRTKKYEDDNLLIIRTAKPVIHSAENLVDVNFDIKITNKQSCKSENINELHTMRYLFNPEIEILLESNKLKLLHSEEWLTGNPPGLSSWYVTFVCQRI